LRSWRCQYRDRDRHLGGPLWLTLIFSVVWHHVVPWGRPSTSLIVHRLEVRIRNILSIQLHVGVSLRLVPRLLAAWSLWLLIPLSIWGASASDAPMHERRLILRWWWRRLTRVATHRMRSGVWWPTRQLLRRGGR
jgi:hypothetical protein